MATQVPVEIKREGDLVIAKTEKVTISIDTFQCKGCGNCISLCPRNVYEWSKDLSRRGYHYPVPVNAQDCVKCRLCEHLCPDFAIEVVG